MRPKINSRVNLSVGRVVQLNKPIPMESKSSTKNVTIEWRKGQYLLARNIGYWPAPSKGYWNIKIKREHLASLTSRTWKSEDEFFFDHAPESGMYEYNGIIDLEVVGVENNSVNIFWVNRQDPQLMVHQDCVPLSHWFMSYRNAYKRVKGKKRISTLMKTRGAFLFKTFYVRCIRDISGDIKFTKGNSYRVTGISYGVEGKQYNIKDDTGLLTHVYAKWFVKTRDQIQQNALV